MADAGGDLQTLSGAQSLGLSRSTAVPANPRHQREEAVRGWTSLDLPRGEEFLYCVKAAGCAAGSAASGRACGLRPVPPYAAPHITTSRRPTR
jgi:hypothetical protein